jgi:hypothetical protein
MLAAQLALHSRLQQCLSQRQSESPTYLPAPLSRLRGSPQTHPLARPPCPPAHPPARPPARPRLRQPSLPRHARLGGAHCNSLMQCGARSPPRHPPFRAALAEGRQGDKAPAAKGKGPAASASQVQADFDLVDFVLRWGEAGCNTY